MLRLSKTGQKKMKCMFHPHLLSTNRDQGTLSGKFARQRSLVTIGRE